ncbi:MAG: carboxymuconolactone decarboxylase family protein [Gallionella sp.]|nr:carboxymuconolactone decarboxylase family protein [Gallionella sp.]
MARTQSERRISKRRNTRRGSIDAGHCISVAREIACTEAQGIITKYQAAFQNFSQAVFANGALPAKVKQIIAVAVAHVTQCPYCIKGPTKAALRHGASQEELMEAIWVAAEMRAGEAYAHSVLAIEEMEKAAAANA